MGKKVGVTTDDVVEVAAAIAEREGLEGLTLSAVAQELKIRPPSLYTHVDGLDGLRREMGLRAFRLLIEYLEEAIDAAVGSLEAVRAVCHAYRRFALENPGLYQAMITGNDLASDDEIWALGAQAMGPVMKVVGGLGLGDEDGMEVFRLFRASLHGFVTLELYRGFALDVGTDASFDRLVEVLLKGVTDEYGLDPSSASPAATTARRKK